MADGVQVHGCGGGGEVVRLSALPRLARHVVGQAAVAWAQGQQVGAHHGVDHVHADQADEAAAQDSAML